MSVVRISTYADESGNPAKDTERRSMLRIGHLAVTEAVSVYDGGKKRWTITHIPTGCSLHYKWLSLKAARDLLRRIDKELDVDWSRIDFGASKDSDLYLRLNQMFMSVRE